LTVKQNNAKKKEKKEKKKKKIKIKSKNKNNYYHVCMINSCILI